MAAARYLGVPVWELEGRSTIYVHRALAARAAEAHAEEMKSKHG